jgi:hypothetical protein
MDNENKRSNVCFGYSGGFMHNGNSYRYTTEETILVETVGVSTEIAADLVPRFKFMKRSDINEP